MAVSFTKGSLTLANWGFGAGDIAVLAGAGRSVGNWLLANAKDRSLFEFLDVDVENVILRKGLIDVGTLHQTWDTQLVLLKNGKKFKVKAAGGKRGPVVENMDKFTWLMTLIVAGLDAALTSKAVHLVVSAFMIKWFEEAVAGLEFVEHEVVHHIQGWRSASSVRGIGLKAREIWDRLGSHGQHWPGMVPSSDCGELTRLLIWIAAGQDEHFYTASSDVYCLAVLLRGIGLGILVEKTSNPCFHEGQIHVVLRHTLDVPVNVSRQIKYRRGMRIPLDFMEESVSVWPGTRELTNTLRKVFEDGKNACEADHFTFIPFYDCEVPYSATGTPFQEEDIDFRYQVKYGSQKPIPRLAGDVNRLTRICLPVETPAAARGLESLCENWRADDLHDIVLFLDSDYSSDSRDVLSANLDESVAQLQAYILGFYYSFLQPLINPSELAIKEGYGAWRWYDMELFRLLKTFIGTRLHRKIKSGKDKVHFFPRHEILKLLAFLFAGADLEQLENIKMGSLGVVGKLTLVNSSLLGEVTEPAHIGRFHLLDTDPTAIPSNTGGIISSGRTRQRDFVFPESIERQEFIDINKSGSSTDFTSHIEPDWERDNQTCLLTYRHNGRIVHRVNPRQVDVVMWREFMKLDPTSIWAPVGGVQPKTSIPDELRKGKFTAVSLSEFHGGKRIWPKLHDNSFPSLSDTTSSPSLRGLVLDDDPQVLLIATENLPKAFTCIKTLYEGWSSEQRLELISPAINPGDDEPAKHSAIVVVLLPAA